MRLLVTGSEGFIGKNLCAHIAAAALGETLRFDKDTDPALLDDYAGACGFVFHLAGVNRPRDESGFEENVSFTERLVQSLERQGRNVPMLMSSSAQARLDNPYGRSKKRAEAVIFSYAERTGARVYVYRLPGVFGKWCAPHYNSVVATFCHDAARGLPLRVDDPDAVIELAYIDDVITAFLGTLHGEAERTAEYCVVPVTHHASVGHLAEMIGAFGDRRSLLVPDMGDALTRKLYSTYLSYLPENDFTYPLAVHADERGCYAEFLKSAAGGQVSVNVARPGSTKGGHWHHTKIEKILVVSGSGVIRFQKAGEERVISYALSADRMEVVDIPVGYAHAITNTGDKDLVMVIWASQLYDPQHPDTFPVKIGKGVFYA